MKGTKPPSVDAITVLVDNRRKFMSFLKNRVANQSDAEEILQSAFLKGICKSGSIRNVGSVVAWFYRVLRNEVIDYYRHQDVDRRAMEQMVKMNDGKDSIHPDLECTVCRCVTGLLRKLREDYSKLLTRVDTEGASIAEVVQETSMNANQARVKLHRARKALHKELRLYCGGCAERGCLECDCPDSLEPQRFECNVYHGYPSTR